MNAISTLGLPKFPTDDGERGAFLPSFVHKLDKFVSDIYIERGYGRGLEINDKCYLSNDKNNIHFVSHEETYKQDLVIGLKAPTLEELSIIRRGAFLIGMLHYESRPKLVEALKMHGIFSYSLDSIIDDRHQRLVVSYEMTASNGVREAYNEIVKRRSDFLMSNRAPFLVAIMGMGYLGIEAGKASFLKFGDTGIDSVTRKRVLPGAAVVYLEKKATHCKKFISDLFPGVDLLIDATKRVDFTKYIIPNEWLGYLKKEAVILDLTCDPYDTTVSPIQVKAIEGIPSGTLNQYVFETHDVAWEKIPESVDKKNRRVVVSCNGWPGLTPREVMPIYGEQIMPFVRLLIRKGGKLSLESNDPQERALYRSSLEAYLASQ
jgi:alanine dehydrogenase